MVRGVGGVAIGSISTHRATYGAGGGNFIGVSVGVAVGSSGVAVPGGDANAADERGDGLEGKTRPATGVAT